MLSLFLCWIDDWSLSFLECELNCWDLRISLFRLIDEPFLIAFFRFLSSLIWMSSFRMSAISWILDDWSSDIFSNWVLVDGYDELFNPLNESGPVFYDRFRAPWGWSSLRCLWNLFYVELDLASMALIRFGFAFKRSFLSWLGSIAWSGCFTVDL